MDIRADNIQADGFGVAFVDVATHGNDLVRSGAGGRRGEEERAAYSQLCWSWLQELSMAPTLL